MLAHDEICQAWRIAPVVATRTPETGTIHQTLLIETIAGKYALRAYRYDKNKRERIVYEHDLIAYAHEQGLPVLKPLPLVNGETIFEQDEHFYALFPFANGRQVKREDLTGHEFRMMGSFLGRLHQALTEYPHERVQHRIFEVDLVKTLATLEKIETAIRSQDDMSGQDRETLKRLAERRKWLMQTTEVSTAEYTTLERQVIHGDYQETNLFFVDGKVSAVIDWDQAYVAPRAWEVVRTLHYACRLQGEACRIFLEAYRSVQPLSTTELEIAAATYGWIRAHDTWHYEAIYLEGNQRVRAFLQPGTFIPFAQKWANVRAFLTD